MVTKERKQVELFTDGACSGNPGPGGWGTLLRYKQHEKMLSAGFRWTTNNRMELLACIHGLKALTSACDVDLYTDSQYVKQGITQWIHNWRQRNWLTSDKKPVKNQDLWRQLDVLCQQHQVQWHWVKGHAGHRENEMADQAAREAISGSLAIDESFERDSPPPG